MTDQTAKKDAGGISSNIVQCKDCKYYKAKQGSLPWRNARKYCNRSSIIAMNPDDFCSRGEKMKRDKKEGDA